MIRKPYCFVQMFATFAALGFASFALAQSAAPMGYDLLIEEGFDEDFDMIELELSDDSAWRVGNDNGNKVLELHGKSDYQPRVRSPHNIALFRTDKIGSFVLEARMKQTGREYGHRDLCVFFGVKDPTNFYYTHIASVADPHAHNIFLVNDEPRIAIASKTTLGVDWGQDWHTVRVERDIETGMIKVYFDDLNEPIMEATDAHFDYGYIGFGSFDDTGMIDDVKVWGEWQDPKDGVFR